jgi:hypothetical protein
MGYTDKTSEVAHGNLRQGLHQGNQDKGDDLQIFNTA